MIILPTDWKQIYTLFKHNEDYFKAISYFNIFASTFMITWSIYIILRKVTKLEYKGFHFVMHGLCCLVYTLTLFQYAQTLFFCAHIDNKYKDSTTPIV